jgi:dolichol-phosphate mannosyltransferase
MTDRPSSAGQEPAAPACEGWEGRAPCDRATCARALLVIPTYNEVENIDAVLDAVAGSVPEASVLVIDDGSPDGTAEMVEARTSRSSTVHLLRGNGKQGLGRAYITGFRWGLSRGFDYFVEMDADFSHDPAAIPHLLAAARRYDVAIGCRYMPGGRVEGWSKGRHLLSRAGNVYARAALGFRVRDSTSGFRCYRRPVLEAIGLDQVQSSGYAFQIDMTYRAWRLGFSIGEVPITFRERSLGESKMSRAIVAEALWAVGTWRLRDLARAAQAAASSKRVAAKGP